jgi:hypothetical protein
MKVSKIIKIGSGDLLLAIGTFVKYLGEDRKYCALLSSSGSIVPSPPMEVGFSAGSVLHAAVAFDDCYIIAGQLGTYNGTTITGNVAKFDFEGNLLGGFTVTGFTTVTSACKTLDGNLALVGFDSSIPTARVKVVSTADGTAAAGWASYAEALIGPSASSVMCHSSGKLLISYPGIDGKGLIKFDKTAGIVPFFLVPSFVASSGAACVYAMCETADGDVVIGGNFIEYRTAERLHIAKIDFDQGGVLDFAEGEGFDAPVRSIVLQGEDYLVVGGDFTSYGVEDAMYFCRLRPNGDFDPIVEEVEGIGRFRSTVSLLDAAENARALAESDAESQLPCL